MQAAANAARNSGRDLTRSVKNAANIALIPEKMRNIIFGRRQTRTESRLQELALKHLKNHDLLGKATSDGSNMPDMQFPKLLGKSLDEHFSKIGDYLSRQPLAECEQFIAKDPGQFNFEIKRQSGWVRYTKDGAEPVDFPRERVIVFDVEVLYKISDYAVMATAVSDSAWYVWLSPWLLDETSNPEHLISLGNHEQVVVGHKISYDRKRVKEEYSLKASPKFFLDTMSLHIATAGMCSRQRPLYNKFKKQEEEKRKRAKTEAVEEFADDDDALFDDPWLDYGTLNGVANVYKFNFPDSPIEMDKSDRDYFAALDKTEVTSRLEQLVSYCALDVYCTKQILDKTLPRFRELCPHPVSFAALRQMGSLFLPINHKWTEYVKSADAKFLESKQRTASTLEALALELSERKGTDEDIANDPWISQLDWTVKPPRYTQAGELVKRQKLPGKPNWFKDLFASAKAPMNLTLRTRITPLLLRLEWDKNPLVYIKNNGWCFRTDPANVDKYTKLNFVQVKNAETEGFACFKVPHKDGAEAKCGNPMAKHYMSHFESGLLTSQNEAAVSMLAENIQVSYWLSSRERVASQMPVYESPEVPMGYDQPGGGMIIPDLVVMGTVTRRAVENLWLTASNAKKTRLGSELKAMVTAPEGYSFVGADVDSEELWIASVIGDSLFGLHGGTALGWMTLEGSKSNGTDLHSRTASILGISRDQAKIFNYGRIYGAGEKFATQLLKQFNPNISDKEAQEAAKKLYRKMKGSKAKTSSGNFWQGGSESVAFNQLELMAGQDQQRTPILGAGITGALALDNLNKNQYLTSRINWSIQSSGVDYLHLIIVSMEYLCRAYGINARLMITIHDEIRYMCTKEDELRTALALQVANVWTRAMFCQQLGLDDLPQSVAFFSCVDIDHVLRKEVDLECVTPSHPTKIEPGRALNIDELTQQCSSLGPVDEAFVASVDGVPYKYRPPVMSQLRAREYKGHLQAIVSQVATDRKHTRELMFEMTAGSGGFLPGVSSVKGVRV